MLHLPALRTLLRRHLAWLVWLALLLPAAQAAAAAHELSHLGGPPSGQKALHLGQCELCLTAAGLGSAAPAASPPMLPPVAPGLALQATPARGVWLPAPAEAYSSRAPPAARR